MSTAPLNAVVLKFVLNCLQRLRMFADSQPKRIPDHLSQVADFRGQQIRIQRWREVINHGDGRLLQGGRYLSRIHNLVRHARCPTGPSHPARHIVTTEILHVHTSNCHDTRLNS